MSGVGCDAYLSTFIQVDGCDVGAVRRYRKRDLIRQLDAACHVQQLEGFAVVLDEIYNT